MPVVAWVYIVGATSGATMLEVTLPITPRARPAAAASVPEEIGDKYTAAVDAVNTQVAALKEGNVTVANALNAAQAGRASEADHAGRADSATNDSSGNKIAATYQLKNRGGFQPLMYFAPVSGCLYMFRVTVGGSIYYAPILWSTNEAGSVSLGYGFIDGAAFHLMLNKVAGGSALSVTALRASDGFPVGELTDPTIYFCQI
jgi:hypothetical protein